MQFDPRSSRWTVIAVVLLAFGVLPALAGDDKNWFAEIGTEVSHRDNFFFRAEQDGITAPSATLTTLFGSGEVELDAGENSWTFGGAVSGTTTNDIEDADYGTADAAVEFKRRNTRGLLER